MTPHLRSAPTRLGELPHRGRTVGKGNGHLPRHLPAAGWSPRFSPEAPALKGQSRFSSPGPPQAGSRRVVAPSTQCPWQSGQPPHHKGPFVLTSLAPKPRATRLCWAQGPVCGLSPLPTASAGPCYALRRGLLSPVQTHLSNLCLPDKQRPMPHSTAWSMQIQ